MLVNSKQSFGIDAVKSSHNIHNGERPFATRYQTRSASTTADTIKYLPSSPPHSVISHLCFLRGATVLAICAAHLLGTCSFLAWLTGDAAFGLLKGALDLVRDRCFSLVMRVRSSFLGDTSSGSRSLSGRLLSTSLGGSLALALWSGRDSW